MVRQLFLIASQCGKKKVTTFSANTMVDGFGKYTPLMPESGGKARRPKSDKNTI